MEDLGVVRRRLRCLNWLIVLSIGFVLVLISPVSCGWPEGTYGIPAHKYGCPDDGTGRWKTGSVMQKTELGSHSSVNNHLFGFNDASSDRILQTFCMKTSFHSDYKHHFMPGQYCLFKLHECPARFQEGWIYWDDAGPWFGSTIQTAKGILPDGQFNRNTQIEYCCRSDGDSRELIALPSGEPFYLLKYGDLCQEVEGMNVVEEWVVWSGESSFNRDSESGVHPKMERNKYFIPFTKLFYCYYVPKSNVEVSPGSWFDIFLIVVYITGATVGIIFLVAVVLATFQRALIFHRRHQQNKASTANRSSNEHRMASSSRPNPAGSLPAASHEQKNGANTDMASKVKVAIAHEEACAKDQSCPEFGNLEFEDSEAPPSYDEVLREGYLNVVV